jgi:NAD+ diphosphatase
MRVDRAAERRDTVDPALCDAIVVHNGAVLAADGRLVEFPPGTHPDAELTVYLGQDGDRDVVAIVPRLLPASTQDDGIGSERMTPLRELMGLCAARGEDGLRDHELAATAVAVTTWHANHPRCSVCGDPTEPQHGGWVRHCARDDKEHYPRTDPAVIVAITDEQDRLLMAHAAYWSPRRFSHLAGYVEPGESMEQAVHREVLEEAGLVLTDLTYLGSQAWPFPASLMVAYAARARAEDLNIDHDEISEAMFVTREELGALVADGTVILAPPGSIARRMLESWRDGEVPL